MREAAAGLAPMEPVPADAPQVFYLTGKAFWYQTAFCFWSLCRNARIPLRLALVDDGSLDQATALEAQRLFPGVRIAAAQEVERRLDTLMPVSKYPTLRGLRTSYVHLRKLTDVHAGHDGYRLVLDSDMLIFQRPRRLLDWLQQPSGALHMEDVQDAYGYPLSVLDEFAGGAGALPRRVNVGVFGIRSDSIDWDYLEDVCAALLLRHGSSYYLEQALSALLISRRGTNVLPGTEYRVMPTLEEAASPTAVLHHYVAESKAGYFRHAWRRVLATR